MSKISISYPESGLTPAISVVNMTTEVQDFSGTMNEIGSTKVYTYEFTEVANTDYAYVITTTGYEPVSDALFYETAGGWGGWLTTEEHDKLFSLENSTWGGGASINIQWIQTTIRNARDSIVEEMNKKHTDTIEKFNDTNSHIDIAKNELSNKIDSIEIPEAILEEKEAKKAIKLITSVDKKLTSYIESEMKEKDEIDAITQEFTRQEVEDMKAKKLLEEEKKKMEEEEAKKEEELMKQIEEEVKQEFERQEKAEMEEKKKELEKELEETLKEAEEIKKELNSIQ